MPTCLYSFLSSLSPTHARTHARTHTHTHSDGVVRVNYHVSAYFLRVPPHLPSLPSLPSPHTLAAVVQTVVQSGCLGTFQTDPDSHVVHRESLCLVVFFIGYTHTPPSSPSPSVNCSSRPCGPHRSCYTITPNPQTFMCPSCPAGTRMDGVLCRTMPPQVREELVLLPFLIE